MTDAEKVRFLEHQLERVRGELSRQRDLVGKFTRELSEVCRERDLWREIAKAGTP